MAGWGQVSRVKSSRAVIRDIRLGRIGMTRQAEVVQSVREGSGGTHQAGKDQAWRQAEVVVQSVRSSGWEEEASRNADRVRLGQGDPG
jgi:hypothetical protein